MRPALAVLGSGLAVLFVQGVAVEFLPAHWVPDLGLLVVVAAGLSLGATSGMLVCTVLGFATDLLSGALLGQHALVRLVAFALTRAANRQLHLRRSLPLAVFVLGITLASGVGLLGLSRLFGGPEEAGPALGGALLVNAGVNALLAAPVAGAVGRLAGTPDEAGRRGVQLEAGRRIG